MHRHLRWGHCHGHGRHLGQVVDVVDELVVFVELRRRLGSVPTLLIAVVIFGVVVVRAVAAFDVDVVVGVALAAAPAADGKKIGFVQDSDF